VIMNIIGIILIIMFLVTCITMWVFIAKICAVLRTLKAIQSGVAVSVRGVGTIVDGKLKDYKLSGFDVVKGIVKGKDFLKGKMKND